MPIPPVASKVFPVCLKICADKYSFSYLSLHVTPVGSPHRKQAPIAIIRNGTWIEYVPLLLQKSINLFISCSDNGIFCQTSCLMFTIAPFAGFFLMKSESTANSKDEKFKLRNSLCCRSDRLYFFKACQHSFNYPYISFPTIAVLLPMLW